MVEAIINVQLTSIIGLIVINVVQCGWFYWFNQVKIWLIFFIGIVALEVIAQLITVVYWFDFVENKQIFLWIDWNSELSFFIERLANFDIASFDFDYFVNLDIWERFISIVEIKKSMNNSWSSWCVGFFNLWIIIKSLFFWWSSEHNTLQNILLNSQQINFFHFFKINIVLTISS